LEDRIMANGRDFFNLQVSLAGLLPRLRSNTKRGDT